MSSLRPLSGSSWQRGASVCASLAKDQDGNSLQKADSLNSSPRARPVQQYTAGQLATAVCKEFGINKLC